MRYRALSYRGLTGVMDDEKVYWLSSFLLDLLAWDPQPLPNLDLNTNPSTQVLIFLFYNARNCQVE